MSTQRHLLLRGGLVLGRLRVINLVAPLLLLLGIAAEQFLLPHLAAQAQLQRHELSLLELNAKESLAALPVHRLQVQDEHDFYEALGDAAHAEQAIEKLLGAAAAHGLLIQRADYKAGVVPETNISTYQINLPISGTYPALRRFCEQFLREVPFAALDEVNFRRETTASARVEAKFRFTLFLDKSRATLGTPGPKLAGRES